MFHSSSFLSQSLAKVFSPDASSSCDTRFPPRMFLNRSSNQSQVSIIHIEAQPSDPRSQLFGRAAIQLAARLLRAAMPRSKTPEDYSPSHRTTATQSVFLNQTLPRVQFQVRQPKCARFRATPATPHSFASLPTLCEFRSRGFAAPPYTPSHRTARSPRATQPAVPNTTRKT